MFNQIEANMLKSKETEKVNSHYNFLHSIYSQTARDGFKRVPIRRLVDKYNVAHSATKALVDMGLVEKRGKTNNAQLKWTGGEPTKAHAAELLDALRGKSTKREKSSQSEKGTKTQQYTYKHKVLERSEGKQSIPVSKKKVALVANYFNDRKSKAVTIKQLKRAFVGPRKAMGLSTLNNVLKHMLLNNMIERPKMGKYHLVDNQKIDLGKLPALSGDEDGPEQWSTSTMTLNIKISDEALKQIKSLELINDSLYLALLENNTKKVLQRVADQREIIERIALAAGEKYEQISALEATMLEQQWQANDEEQLRMFKEEVSDKEEQE